MLTGYRHSKQKAPIDREAVQQEVKRLRRFAPRERPAEGPMGDGRSPFSPGKGEFAEILRHRKHAVLASEDEVQGTG
jgi:hypothetical protein